jgi:hypothetical protein
VLPHQPDDFAVSLLLLAVADCATAANMVAGLAALEQLGELLLFCQPDQQEQLQEKADDGVDVLQLEACVVLAPIGELQQQMQQLHSMDPSAGLAAVKQLCEQGKLTMLSSGNAQNKSSISAAADASQPKLLHIVSRFAVNKQQQKPMQRNMLLDRAAARGRWEPADAGAGWQALQYKVAAHVRWALQHSAALQGLHLALLQPVVQQ